MINKDELENKLKEKSVIQIAKEYSCSENTIRRAMKKYGLVKTSKKPYQNKETLLDMLQTKTVQEIADYFSVDNHTISRWINKNNISFNDKKPYRNKEWLEQKLKEFNGSLSEISKETGYKKDTMLEWCYKFNLKHTPDFNRKYNLNIDYFKEIDSEIKAYYLGFGMADFGMDKNCYSFEFRLKKDDKYIIEKLAKELNYTADLYHYKDNVREGYALNISSRNICRDLIYHGIVPNKSGKEILPNTVPKKLIKHFVRGFIDGDGYIGGENDKTLAICSMSYNILLSIKLFLEKELNIKEYEIRPTLKESGNILYYYKIYGDSFIKVLDYLYKDSTIYLTRKHDNYLIHLNKDINRKNKKSKMAPLLSN